MRLTGILSRRLGPALPAWSAPVGPCDSDETTNQNKNNVSERGFRGMSGRFYTDATPITVCVMLPQKSKTMNKNKCPLECLADCRTWSSHYIRRARSRHDSCRCSSAISLHHFHHHFHAHGAPWHAHKPWHAWRA